EVDPALVLLEVGDRQQQRLVVDVQLDHRGVRDRDHRLARAGEAEGGFGVVDRPRLVEAVEEGAVALRIAPLLGGAAHPEVAVRGREEGLHEAQVRMGAGLDQPPLVERQIGAVDGVGGQHATAAHEISSRSATTTVAPASASSAAPAPRSTPITAPKPPAAPAPTPETASSSTTARAGSTPRSCAARRKVSGAGLPGRPSRAATLPSTMCSKRSSSPAARSTSSALREEETMARRASAGRASRKATVPGYGVTPSERSSARTWAFFRLPRPRTVSSPRG